MQTIAEEGGDDDPRLEAAALTAQISAKLKVNISRCCSCESHPTVHLLVSE